jgi:hypothetical protein
MSLFSSPGRMTLKCSCTCHMSIFENEVQCALSYVVMENIIFPTVSRLFGCFPISDGRFFKVTTECAFFLSLVPLPLRQLVNCKCICFFLF